MHWSTSSNVLCTRWQRMWQRITYGRSRWVWCDIMDANFCMPPARSCAWGRTIPESDVYGLPVGGMRTGAWWELVMAGQWDVIILSPILGPFYWPLFQFACIGAAFWLAWIIHVSQLADAFALSELRWSVVTRLTVKEREREAEYRHCVRRFGCRSHKKSFLDLHGWSDLMPSWHSFTKSKEK